jgi:hypothetical protein
MKKRKLGTGGLLVSAIGYGCMGLAGVYGAAAGRQEAVGLVTAAILGSAAAAGVATEKPAPLVIQEQGSFAVGGTVVTATGTFDPIRHGAYNPADQSVAGQTLHRDHAYVFYQVPAKARRLPLVMWHGSRAVREDLGDDTRRTPGISEHLPQTPFPGVSRRSAATWARVSQHGPHEPARGARRATLVRDLPPRRVAELLPGRSVRPAAGSPRPVLPADGAEHRSVRHGGERRRGRSTLRQDRPRNPRHALAERRPGLAHGHQEPERSCHRVVRAG